MLWERSVMRSMTSANRFAGHGVRSNNVVAARRQARLGVALRELARSVQHVLPRNRLLFSQIDLA